MRPQDPGPGNNPPEKPVPFATPAGRGVVLASGQAALQALLDRDAADWQDLGLEPVKRSTVRTVLRGRLGPPEARHDVHAKVFRAGKLSDRVRDASRGSRGEREFAHLQALRSLGLPAAEPLAAGICRGSLGSRSFLVTRTVPDARPFGFDAAGGILGRVGALLRQLHDLGLDLPDLHPGNVVVDGLGGPWLLDVTSLRRAGTLDAAARARALAFFCLELDGGALDPAAAGLLDGYLQRGAAMPPDFARRLAQQGRRLRLAALVSFGRRAGRPCRHTEVTAHERGKPRWFLFRSGDPESDARLREQCCAFAAAPPAPGKSGRRGSVWLLDELVVKQRPAAPARHLFRAAYWCHFAGVPCAGPVALRLWRRTGLVFARRVGPRNVLEELRAGELSPAAAVQAARSLGNSVGRLHAHGLRDRDLKFENLVRAPATGAVLLVDLDGLRRKTPGDVRGQGADLGRLLAAWLAAEAPGGVAAWRAFVGGYLRARRRLLMPRPTQELWRMAGRRAREWASAHR
jgi:tRNA A-37 threonylcarbamoyl transferase component Bud32